MLKSVLIANRGEIACRIAATARRMGLRTIAIYSEADVGALHARAADEAHLIGPAPARLSYLDAKAIIALALKTGAEAIHPGYGFLSENAGFAEACATAGLTFVGPPASAIRAMGLKDAAKALMIKAGVPVVPGYHGADQDIDILAEEAAETGYPVLIKAAAGGGGKGMRLVEAHQDFRAALEACRREAASAFGNDAVLIEKYIQNPRHVEMQVFADAHGNAVHLYERDCSLQRRHQKVIEEAPAPGMTQEMRARMGQAAVAAARAVGYAGAGTVEFIADGSEGLRADRFWFMEMNTRLQVEHPVTEAITGLDLVELQFRVAAGQPLPFDQAGVPAIDGHAVEARLYAEDPSGGFLPQAGRLYRVKWPQGLKGIRIDTGVETGAEITPHYDPMIAKIIAHGSSREEALGRLRRALGETKVLGLKSNIAFVGRLAGAPDFVAGDFDTGFIARHAAALCAPAAGPREKALAALAWFGASARQNRAANDPWARADGWVLKGAERTDVIALTVNGEAVRARLTWKDDGMAVALTGGSDATSFLFAHPDWREDALISECDGDRLEALVAMDAARRRCFMAVGDAHVEAAAIDLLARSEDEGAGAGVVRAPMSGRVIKVMAGEGDVVARGAALVILEAMKMEHVMRAGHAGQVTALPVSEGDQVAEGQVLANIAAVDEPALP
jgi:3-methylcrotonyl-CoA carboxylase alpha subunit